MAARRIASIIAEYVPFDRNATRDSHEQKNDGARARSGDGPASCRQGRRDPDQPRIVVTGEGEATVAPDMALLSLTVMREAKTAREALDANNAAMAEVIEAIKLFGIADRDLQTAGLQIMPRYNFTNNRTAPRKLSSSPTWVTNTLSVRVRDMVKTGEVIDKAVSLGVNQGGNIVFTNDDFRRPPLPKARKRAVAEARPPRQGHWPKPPGVTARARTWRFPDRTFGAQPMPIEAKAVRPRGGLRAGRGRRERLSGPGQHDLRAEIARNHRGQEKAPEAKPRGFFRACLSSGPCYWRSIGPKSVKRFSDNPMSTRCRPLPANTGSSVHGRRSCARVAPLAAGDRDGAAADVDHMGAAEAVAFGLVHRAVWRAGAVGGGGHGDSRDNHSDRSRQPGRRCRRRCGGRCRRLR